MSAAATRSETIEVDASTGALQTYVALPSEPGPHPGVLVIQEVFGLTDHIRAQADKLAAAGYIAAAPDLYYLDEVRKTIDLPDIEDAIMAVVSGNPDEYIGGLPEDRQDTVRRALAWRTGNSEKMPTFVADASAILSWLSARDDVEKVGSIGWCMGGGINAAMVATGVELDAASIWYGPLPTADKVANIKAPLELHYGTADQLAGAVPAFEEAAKAAGKDVTSYLYEDAPHAFNNEQRASYRADASALAWERTWAFFAKHLGS